MKTSSMIKSLTFIRDLGYELSKQAPDSSLGKDLIQIVFPRFEDPCDFHRGFPLFNYSGEYRV